ncbi:hypothetical protein JJQ59_28405 [Cupriavidus necator]|uniref:Uncharacterized protein n=1 Tax=Cupriavidus necator TaxID=106590 RepID=A0A367PH97_CUPNE|nr:hypothetical protein [Cupriavidus necator]QQX86684.1 hypothetical protein JJQ59_28405 [Cupriavidus necator]RCJ07239.1 hypothetical protein DDK22_17685 [Cupriavidus necator]
MTAALAVSQASQNADGYNWVYRELVGGSEDVCGALAYALYKQQKIAYIEEFVRSNHRQPTDAELQEFHRVTCLPVTLQSYSERAENLLNVFLQVALEEKARETEEKLKAAQLTQFLADSTKELRTSVTSIKGDMNQEVGKVLKAIEGKRGFFGWIGELGANLLINLLTVLVIGLAVVGLGTLDNVSGALKDAIPKAAQVKGSSDKPSAEGASSPPQAAK